MPKRVPRDPEPRTVSRSRTALTNEARENQMISLAMDAAERQMREGTASSQVIVHYLKLGSSKERLTKDILERQRDLIIAKTKALESSERMETLYADALKAMRTYSGERSGKDE